MRPRGGAATGIVLALARQRPIAPARQRPHHALPRVHARRRDEHQRGLEFYVRKLQVEDSVHRLMQS